MKNEKKILNNRQTINRILVILMSILSATLSIIYGSIMGYSPFVTLLILIPTTVLSAFGANHALSGVFALYTILNSPTNDPISPLNKALPIAENTKIAVLIFVYEESASAVAGRIATMVKSLQIYSFNHQIEWFILSDTQSTDIIAQEIVAFFELQSRFPDNSFHYRNRIVNTFAKVGNMGDFLRRFGSNFKYAILLDADSVMPASTIHKMSEIMEGNPDIGIIQGTLLTTPPNSLFGTIYSYMSIISAEMTTAAQYYFRYGEASYCGHNSIIRMDPFIKYCHLPVFSQQKPFPEGKFTSHDFVESALLRARGFKTISLPELVAFDLEVSNFILWAVREQRWLSGALNWLRVWRWDIFFGFIGVELMANALKYFQAILGFSFFLFMLIGFKNLIDHPYKSIVIYNHFQKYLSYTFILGITLFLISFLCNFLYIKKILKIKKISSYVKYYWCSILSFIFSAFSAPIKMILVCLFIFSWARSSKVAWNVNSRDSYVPTWKESIKFTFPVLITGILSTFFLTMYCFSNITPHKFLMLKSFQSLFLLFFIFMILPMLLSPITVRLTAKQYPIINKFGWFSLKFPQSRMDFSEFISNINSEISFYEAKVPTHLTIDDIYNNQALHNKISEKLPSRPHKFAFWREYFYKKSFEECSRKEKLLIIRCKELWDYLKHI